MLKTILKADCILGGVTAITGLVCSHWLSDFLGLPADLILIIAIITLAYAGVALTLALQQEVIIPLLKILIYANWVWAFISLGILYYYSPGATIYGVIFLVLQVMVVGLLAYLEGIYMRG
ncbi:hypothetical protein [Chitinophaga rhizophila]|uniref:DUF2127 domain-containing protein n=1 Tax=Chitinophaga rhizophila TaxID=2866212 RepID=A0ABS7GLT7_9BACT|nr:hypothetical protein [Chitinophaga rhizophila]MBW8688190.1 hypothetical protein [Chitinophaga rhizophila]